MDRKIVRKTIRDPRIQVGEWSITDREKNRIRAIHSTENIFSTEITDETLL